MKIVVVEDQLDLREELVDYLNKIGHPTRGASSGSELDRLIAQEPAELVLLDIGLPGEDGIAIAQRLHDVPNLGIVMLTARSGEEDRIQSFEAGADTYLVKPVSYRELEAVIQRAQARLQAGSSEPSSWQLKPRERVLTAPNQQEVQLTLTESRLLAAIIARPDRVATRQQLVESLGLDFLNYDDRRIEVSMSRLRKKIHLSTNLKAPLKASRNVGYAFQGQCMLR